MTEAHLRRQVELLTAKLAERNTTIGNLTQQVDVLEANASQSVATTDSGATDRTIKQEIVAAHAENEGDDKGPHGEHGSDSDSNASDDDLQEHEQQQDDLSMDGSSEDGLDAYWDSGDPGDAPIEGVWRCRLCRWEVIWGECTSCGELRPGCDSDNRGEPEDLDYARIVSPFECCSECFELASHQLPPDWTPTYAPWTVADVFLALGLRTISDDDAKSLLDRGASPAMIQLFKLTYTGEGGIIATLDQELVREFVGIEDGDDEYRVALGQSISLDKDDIDGTSFMFETMAEIDSESCTNLMDEKVWILVAANADCGHWRPALPPVWEGGDRPSEKTLAPGHENAYDWDLEDEDAIETEDGPSSESESEATPTERGSSDSEDSEMEVEEAAKGGGEIFWAGFLGLVGQQKQEEGEAMAVEEAAPSSQELA
ncbi:hypothetical protein RQP46_008881 [Phenoliferia psychrophenolica]